MVSRINVRQQAYKVFTFVNNILAKVNAFNAYMSEDELEKVYQKLCTIEGFILDVGDILADTAEEHSEDVGEEDINLNR